MESNDLSPEEAERRATETLRRLLTTPKYAVARIALGRCGTFDRIRCDQRGVVTRAEGAALYLGSPRSSPATGAPSQFGATIPWRMRRGSDEHGQSDGRDASPCLVGL